MALDSLILPSENYYKIIKEVRIVSGASPTPLPSYITELVGDQVSFTQSGLNGDLHKKYKIELRLVNTLNADNWCMRWNGVSTSVYDMQQSQFTANTVSGGTTFTAATLFSVAPIAQTSVNIISMNIDAQTGANRTFMVNQYGTQSSQQAPSVTTYVGGSFRDSSTNLTSILFTSNGGNMRYGVGTIVRIFALCK
jgi:hypothetical protein